VRKREIPPLSIQNIFLPILALLQLLGFLELRGLRKSSKQRKSSKPLILILDNNLMKVYE